MLTRTSEGLRADIRVADGTSTLTFVDLPSVRRDRWSEPRQVGPGAFEVELPADAREYDRIHPSVTRIGEAFVLYGPALHAAELPADATVRVTQGEITVPHLPRLLGGYVFVGPVSMVQPREGYALIGADAVPPWIGETVNGAAESVFPFFASHLGALPTEPTVAVSTDVPGPMGFHGDVSDNGFVFLRFHGEAWTSRDEAAAAKIETFVRHEAFHLWNRGTTAGTPPWLHEGGAEYAGLVAAVSAGALSEAQARTELSARASACRATLGPHPFTELPPGGSALYDCGVVVQWVADLAQREEHGDILTLWGQLLAPTAGYGLEGFRALAGPEAEAFVDSGNWSSLIEWLEGRGITIDETPLPRSDRSDLLRHLMQAACGTQQAGFWTEPDFVRLDTGEDCGVLSHQAELTQIETHDIIDAPAAAFDAAAERCRDTAPVRATLRSGAGIEVPCAVAPARTPGFEIVANPPIGLR